jgi:hypothetical protein
MMKLAINRKFGGFSVSVKGMLEIAKRKGLKVYPYIESSDFSMFSGHYVKETKICSNELIVYYLLKDVGDEFEGDIYNDVPRWEFNPSDYKNRTDPDLIATIESLGEEANGKFGELKVVEIPDGFDYEINDYDGLESVYYGNELGVID